MATLLVIGGTGFFGKSILDCFQRGLLKPWFIDHVIVMARNAEFLRSEAPFLLSGSVELLSANIVDIKYLPAADYVIHAAASSDARDYLRSPAEARQNIIGAVLNYCKLATQFHPHSKILYVSSGAVYGAQPENIEYLTEAYQALNSEGIQESKRDYTYSKRDSEEAIKCLAYKGLQVSIARCFAFVGSWLPRDQHFAIGNFIEDALNGRSIVVKAKHKVYRSYMYADDLVEWLMTIASSSSNSCPIFNVGSNHPVLLGDLARQIANISQVEADIPIISEASVDRYIPSIDKAKSELNLYLKYNLIDAIIETIRKTKSL